MSSQPPESHDHEHHHSLRDEIHHLEEVAEKGDSGETPFIEIGRVWFFLVPIVVVVLGIALAAYYIF